MRFSATMGRAFGWEASGSPEGDARRSSSPRPSRTLRGTSGRPPPHHAHDHHDGRKLQQHAPPHQLLRAARAAAPHHVEEAKGKDDADGADGDEDEKVSGLHGGELARPAASGKSRGRGALPRPARPSMAARVDAKGTRAGKGLTGMETLF